MNKVEVCLTPDLIQQYDLTGKLVVAVDIFRATSCMVTGMAYGVKAIHPVGSVEECLELGKRGMITAGERGGIKVEGFQIGNSPYDYMQEEFRGQSIAVTTTNGTRTILASTPAEQILIGAFLNLEALSDFIGQSQRNVIIHCAGWKGTVNIEDTLFAGALIEELQGSHELNGDPGLLAHELYKAHRLDLLSIAKASAHAKRLAGFGVDKDIEFCLTPSMYTIIPEYKDGFLKPLS